MRILDCKSPVCSEIAKEAPVVLDYICDDCRDHFEKLQSYLSAMNIDYVVNPQIVRGLDYYTRTVFEFVSLADNTEGLVLGGGGRYDGLIEELGGASLLLVALLWVLKGFFSIWKKAELHSLKHQNATFQS